MRPEESPPDLGGSDRVGHRQRRLRVVKPATEVYDQDKDSGGEA